MRILYHFIYSPFSRRIRLALAHKGLVVELREARSNPKWRQEALSLFPLGTIPVLLEEDGRAIGDSAAIAHYLDATYPTPTLWPRGDDAALAAQVASLVDGALTVIVDLGTRYYALRDHPAWAEVRAEMQGRAQRALDRLGVIVGSQKTPTLGADGWSAADMWLYTAVAWLDGLPSRTDGNPNIAQILSLGWTLPEQLRRWAEPHRSRDDVRALDAAST